MQAASSATSSAAPATRDHAPTDIEYDAVIIGSGMGGLTTATQLASKGMRNVLVLEKYAAPTLHNDTLTNVALR